ncbi:MAG TPA: cation:proton antiporter, partial [Gaiellales bacterium]|nr:cation:proton antiporter [Gaiellales bacterium]
MPTILGGLAIILAVAKLGGDLATRARQPAVLGELIAGVILGNLGLVGITGLQGLAANSTLDALAQVGVIILLFEVGLESTVHDMLKVGAAAVLVATLGVIAPFVLGWLVGAALLPAESGYAHAFLGATLTATSVGITARVLRDLGKGATPEARVILGAAVVDDVFGLVILAVLTGLITAADAGMPVAYGSVAWIVGKAALFLCGAIALGLVVS